ncbi:MAG: hypothetical protein SA339_06035 [Methanomassiliicoccus sp.]|nr:hypothetical protein [Methanomassiliicoccus sp.]
MSFIGIFGKKYEEERLEANMLDSLASDLRSDAEKVKRRLVKRATNKPQDTILLLLRNYGHEDERVRKAVAEILTELAGDRVMLSIILADMVHPSRAVRKAVQGFLGEYVGPHATIYASLYEQTMLQAAMSKRKEIPVDDIVALAELSRETFMDGEVMESVRDIGFCLDQAKHRFRSAEQLRDYLSDFLKMAPDLTRMGVYSGAIEEPLRKAMKASRNRSFDETRETIEERTKEAALRHDLRAFVLEIGVNITFRPTVDDEAISDEGRKELTALRGFTKSIEELSNGGRRMEAIDALHDFIGDFLRRYQTGLGPRIRAGDREAAATMYAVALTCVKLTSYLLPVTAEGAYLEGFRSLEGAVSIHILKLPW